MSDAFEITESAARGLLPCMKDRLSDLELQIDGLSIERDSLRVSIAEITAKLERSKVPKGDDGKRGRLPNGAAESSIVNLLANLPDKDALTASQISDRTGVNQPTVFRILNDPVRNQGRFEKEGKKWRLKK